MQEKEQNISPIKQRILHFIDSLNISHRDFYTNTGISRGTMSNSSGISEDTLSKLFATYNNLNPRWLFAGVGDMLSDNVVNEPSSNYNKMCQQCNEKDLLITNLNKMIDTLTVQISEAAKDKELYRNLLATYTQPIINKQAS